MRSRKNRYAEETGKSIRRLVLLLGGLAQKDRCPPMCTIIFYDFNGHKPDQEGKMQICFRCMDFQISLSVQILQVALGAWPRKI